MVLSVVFDLELLLFEDSLEVKGRRFVEKVNAHKFLL
jgi:hypothetical protein